MDNIMFLCWVCKEPHRSSELPPDGPYYRGEVDSLFVPCKNCGGQVRSRSGKIMGKIMGAIGGREEDGS